jgi:hypothetical protein
MSIVVGHRKQHNLERLKQRCALVVLPWRSCVWRKHTVNLCESLAETWAFYGSRPTNVSTNCLVDPVHPFGQELQGYPSHQYPLTKSYLAIP